MSDQLDLLRRETAGGSFCLLPYCHPDFSWVHHREWHEERYAVTIADALDLMAQHPDFRFCIEPWIDQVLPFLERCPERTRELADRLNTGQMGVLAFTLTSPRPVYGAEETFLRNMVLGREEYHALAPEADLSVMSCPDVGLGHSQLPQLLRLAGARLYRGWRSHAAFDAKGLPREFHWRGLDGTEILTSRGCYGGLVSTQPFETSMSEDWEAFLQGLLRDWLNDGFRPGGCRVRWVAQGMDDSRPLRAWPHDNLLPLFEMVEAWNAHESSRMLFATPAEYARLLAQEDLPVVQGVIDPVDVAYNVAWGGGQGLWRYRQNLEVALLVAERASALAAARGLPAAGPEELRALWWEAVRINSHAQQWAFQKDFDWLMTGARTTLREAEALTDRAVHALAGGGRACGARRPLLLFNPLPYDREELISVPCVQPRQDVPGFTLFDESGAEVPLQLGEPEGESWGGMLVEAPLVFRARVPALGVAVYEIGDGPALERPSAPEEDGLDTGALRLRFSSRGLQELTDAASGLVWRAPEGSCLGDVRLFEMGPGPLGIGPITAEIGGAIGSGGWVLTGPQRWVYRWETQFHGHRLVQDVTADRGARHLDFTTRIETVGSAGAFFAFCLQAPFAGALSADIPFGVEPRDLRNEPWGPDLPPDVHNIERFRRNQFWARSFASLTDGTHGISLITVDGDRYWTWEEDARRLRHLLFLLPAAGEGWERWVNWERRALGRHEFRHRLVLHDGDWRAAGLCEVSDRLRFPLRPVKPLGPPQPRMISGPQLSLAPGTVRLSAFHLATQGYVLRVFESAGAATEAVIELPFEPATASKTDFHLQPLEGVPPTVEGNRLRVPLRAWEIATILLQVGPG